MGSIANMGQVPKLTPQQIRSIKQSPKGELPKFLQVGNSNIGASLLRTKDGSEIQAGVTTRKGTNVHIDAGYSKSRGTAGFGASLIRNGKRTGVQKIFKIR